MKNEWLSCAVIAATMVTGAAWAGDSSSTDSASGSHKQMMKECMARQKAQNSGASAADMKKSCRDEVKMHGGSHAMGSDAPDQTTPTTKGNPAPQTGSQTNPPQ